MVPKATGDVDPPVEVRARPPQGTATKKTVAELVREPGWGHKVPSKIQEVTLMRPFHGNL